MHVDLVSPGDEVVLSNSKAFRVEQLLPGNQVLLVRDGQQFVLNIEDVKKTLVSKWKGKLKGLVFGKKSMRYEG